MYHILIKILKHKDFYNESTEELTPKRVLPSQFHTTNSRLLFLVKDIVSNHGYVLLVSNQTTADNEKLYSKCYKECSNSLNLENLYNNCSIISLLYHLQCHASTRLTPLLFIMIFYPLMMLALKAI